MTLDLSGLAVALATPFKATGELDLPAFRKLVRHVVAGGANTLVPLGSTGEAATIVEVERDILITACLEESSGRPVVVGTGHNATRQAAAMTKRAQALGAQGALVVTPYYNKPTPDGLVAHFAAVAEAAPGLPPHRLQRAGPHRAERDTASPGAALGEPPGGGREGEQRQPGPDRGDRPPAAARGRPCCPATTTWPWPPSPWGPRGSSRCWATPCPGRPPPWSPPPVGATGPRPSACTSSCCRSWMPCSSRAIPFP